MLELVSFPYAFLLWCSADSMGMNSFSAAGAMEWGAWYGDAGEVDRDGSHLGSLSAASSLQGGCSKADHPPLALSWPDLEVEGKAGCS